MTSFQILIVEDDVMARHHLAALFAEALSESRIDCCEHIEGAVRLIDDMFRSDRAYDLAILDFRLPRHLGESDAVDESVCRHLNLTMPDTVVVHITSFAHDPLITAHLHHSHPVGELRSFFLDKSEVTFATQLISRSRQALFDTRIDRGISALFPDHVRMSVPSASKRGAASVSNRIADLSLDIGLTWRELGDGVRARVLAIFDVVDIDGEDQVTVTLR